MIIDTLNHPTHRCNPTLPAAVTTMGKQPSQVIRMPDSTFHNTAMI